MEAHLELLAPAIDPAEVLSRLEHHVAEAGRLHGRLDVVEETLERERTARRKLLGTLKRERRVAEALKSRAERAEEARDAATDELEQSRKLAAAAQHQLQMTWSRVADLETALAWEQRPLWRKLLRRPPGA
jgi:predicted  nucleic acid-binding Zn-ribbon protein